MSFSHPPNILASERTFGVGEQKKRTGAARRIVWDCSEGGVHVYDILARKVGTAHWSPPALVINVLLSKLSRKTWATPCLNVFTLSPSRAHYSMHRVRPSPLSLTEMGLMANDTILNVFLSVRIANPECRSLREHGARGMCHLSLFLSLPNVRF